MKSVGIDIGSYSIKVAELESTAHSYRILDYLEMPLTQDLSADKKILIIDALRKIANHYRGQNVSFVLAVKQECVSVRYKAFPFKERYKIVKSLPFQLVDEVPFDHADAIYEAKFVGTIGKITEVLSFICPKQHIKEVLSLAADAGIHPKVITAQGLAVTNMVSLWNESPPELSSSLYATDEEALSSFKTRDANGVLDIGHERTIFSTYIGNHLIQTRSLYFGGIHLVKGLAKKYDISQTEALVVLKEKGFVLLEEDRAGASDEQCFFSDIIEKGLADLILPLKRTLFSLSNKQKLNFTQIYLLGGVSHLLNIDKYLSQKLDVLCQPFQYSSYSYSDMELPGKTSCMAIGLAIEGLRRPRNPSVNFRKNELALQDKSFDKFWKAYGYSFKLLAIAVGVFFIYAMVRSHLADDLSQAGYDVLSQQASSPGINLKNAGPVRIQRFLLTKRKEIKDAKELSDIMKIPSALDTMTKISRQFIQKNQGPVEVRRLLIQNELIQIEGEMSRQRQRSLVQKSLQTIAKNGKVQSIRPTIKPTPLPEGSKALTSKDLPFAYKFSINNKR